MGQATAAFASLKWGLWKKHNITIKTKIRLFRTLIIPILLYGSEMWTTLKSDVKKLETFQLRCLRQILGVSLCDHYRNETVRMKCDNQPLIEEQIQKCRLQWFSHVCRMSSNWLPYKLLWREKPDHWRVQWASPKKTWLKNIKEDLKNQRMNINVAKNTAMDRQT